MSAKLNKLRADITKAQAQIREVEKAALTDAQIEQRIDVWLDSQEECVHDNFTSNAYHFAYPNDSPIHWRRLDESLQYRGAQLNLALTVSLNRAEVRKRLVQAALEEAKGLPQVANQAATLSEMRNSLLALERAEEQEIEHLETIGADVYRRPDADPRAILGLKAD